MAGQAQNGELANGSVFLCPGLCLLPLAWGRHQPQVGEAQSAGSLSWGQAKAGQALLCPTLPCSCTAPRQADPADRAAV